MSLKTVATLMVLGALAGCAEPEAGQPDSAAAAGAASTAAASGADKAERAKTPEPAARQASTELTCTYPVKPGDTAKSLIERYGKDAKTETLAGPEGMEIPGVVLWPGDKKRSIEVGFEDEARTQLSYVEVNEGSIWTLSLLKIGDTLEKVRAVNGKPIKFFGFGWDYGGAVNDFGGGALDQFEGCMAQMDLTFDWDNLEYSDGLSGDVELTSEDKIVNPKAIRVSAMGMGFPIAQ